MHEAKRALLKDALERIKRQKKMEDDSYTAIHVVYVKTIARDTLFVSLLLSLLEYVW